jgi:hypothetical protein
MSVLVSWLVHMSIMTLTGTLKHDSLLRRREKWWNIDNRLAIKLQLQTALSAPDIR